MDYDKTKYKMWTWKSPVMLYWVINPWFVLGELALGLRKPKVMLIERNSPKPLAERTLIPCPHCMTLHPGLKWSKQNKTAYMNWFGLYCDNCGKIIPCLTNLTSYILLGLTMPIWFWFKDKWKAKCLEKQKIKLSNPLDLTQKEVKWWRIGLFFGFFMYVFMAILFPLIRKGSITKTDILTGIPISILVGLSYGLSIKWRNRKKLK